MDLGTSSPYAFYHRFHRPFSHHFLPPGGRSRSSVECPGENPRHRGEDPGSNANARSKENRRRRSPGPPGRYEVHAGKAYESSWELESEARRGLHGRTRECAAVRPSWLFQVHGFRADQGKNGNRSSKVKGAEFRVYLSQGLGDFKRLILIRDNGKITYMGRQYRIFFAQLLSHPFPMNSFSSLLVIFFYSAVITAQASPPPKRDVNAPAKIPGVGGKAAAQGSGGGGAQDLLSDTKFAPAEPKKKLGMECSNEDGSALPANHPGYAKCPDPGFSRSIKGKP